MLKSLQIFKQEVKTFYIVQDVALGSSPHECMGLMNQLEQEGSPFDEAVQVAQPRPQIKSQPPPSPQPTESEDARDLESPEGTFREVPQVQMRPLFSQLARNEVVSWIEAE